MEQHITKSVRLGLSSTTASGTLVLAHSFSASAHWSRSLLTGILTCVVLLGWQGSAGAQSLATMGTEEGVFLDFVRPTTDGHYVASHTADGSEVLTRFDTNLQALWTKQVEIPDLDPSGWVRTVALPDGGTCILAEAGTEFILDPDGEVDSTDIRIGLIRLAPDLTVEWSRQLHFVVPAPTFYSLAPLYVNANASGEMVLVLRKGTGLDDHRMIRVSATGDVLWTASVSWNPYVVNGFIPDGSTDCYFTCSAPNNSGPLTLGRIDASGSVLWTKRITYPANPDMNVFHLCVGGDDKLVVCGKQDNNTFLMKIEDGGVPDWFRLATTVPPTGPGISITVLGVEPTTYGYALAMNAYGRGVIQHHALDGAVISGVKTLQTSDGQFDDLIYFNSIGASGDTVTVAGHLVRDNILFGQETIYPVIVRLPPFQQAACYFGTEQLAEMVVPVSELTVEDVSVISILPSPTVTDIPVNVVELPPLGSSALCGAVGLLEHGNEGVSTPWPNPVAQGQAFTIMLNVPSTIELHDAQGRLVSRIYDQPATNLVLATDRLVPGLYTIGLRDVRGAFLQRHELVVE